MNRPEAKPELSRYVISTVHDAHDAANFGVIDTERLIPLEEIKGDGFVIKILPKRKHKLPDGPRYHPEDLKWVGQLTEWLGYHRALIEGDSRAVYKEYPHFQNNNQCRGNVAVRVFGSLEMIERNHRKRGQKDIAAQLAQERYDAGNAYYGEGKRTPYLVMSGEPAQVAILDAIEDKVVSSLYIVAGQPILPIKD